MKKPIFVLALDFETPGLDPAQRPHEVAWVVLDASLVERSRGEAIIAPVPGHEDQWGDYVRNMHETSGLAALLRSGEGHVSVAEAEDMILAAMDAVGEASWNLAGYSVHFDRGFIAVHMPRLHKRLGHQHLDASVLQNLARMAGGRDAFPKPEGSSVAHRAMADVLSSVECLRHFYRVFGGV